MSATPSPFAARLESILDDSRIIADPSLCTEYAVDELSPAAVAKPANTAEVAELVRFAASENLAVIPCGNHTKLGVGMPPARYDVALDMTGLNQIVHYDPGDLTLSVEAGANFNDFAVPLYNQKQFLPLSVPFYFESTIGGIIASGVDCGLRHSYGTARDFLIGAEFVDGTGKLCKSGGRVVKNVSGYDLHKLLIGSLGTLAVITRLNFRTFPAAPVSRGLVVSFPTAEDALSLMRLVRDSAVPAASVEILSPELMQRILEAERNSEAPAAATLKEMFPANCWHLCVSIEGSNEVCARSVRDLSHLTDQPSSKAAQVKILDENEGADLWHGIGQSVPLFLEAGPASAIFKIVQLPSHLGILLKCLSNIAQQASLAHALLVRGSGIVYFALVPLSNEPVNQVASTTGPDSLRHLTEAASSVFHLCAQQNAAATLPWCPTALKHTLNVWGSLVARPDFALVRRLKSAFDPCNLFSPGRL